MGNNPDSSAVGTGLSSPSRSRQPFSYWVHASPSSGKSTHQQHSPPRSPKLLPFLRQTPRPGRNQFTELPSSYPVTFPVYAGRASISREFFSSDSTAKSSEESSHELNASRTDIATNVYEHPSPISISPPEGGDYTLPVKQTNKPPLSIPQYIAFDIKPENNISTRNMSNKLTSVNLINGTSRGNPPRNFGLSRLFRANYLGPKLPLELQPREKLTGEGEEGNVLNKNHRNEDQQKEASKLDPTVSTTMPSPFLRRSGNTQENIKMKRFKGTGHRWVWGKSGRSTTTAPQLTTDSRLDTRVADTYALPHKVPERHFPVAYGGDKNFVHHPQHVLASPDEEYNSVEGEDSPFLQDTQASFTNEPNYNQMLSNRDAIDRDYTHVYHPTSSYSYIQPDHHNYHNEPVNHNYHSHPDDHSYHSHPDDHSSHSHPEAHNYHRKEKPHHPIETKFSLTFPINKTMSVRWYKALTMNASFTDIHNPFKPFLQFGFSSGMEPVYHPHTGYNTLHGHHTPPYKRLIDISSGDTPGDRHVSENPQDSSFDIFNILPKIGLSFARGRERVASAFDPFGSIMRGWDSLKNLFGASDETGEEVSETPYAPEYIPTTEDQPSETYLQSNDVHDPYIGPYTKKPSLQFYETSVDDQLPIHMGKYKPPAIYIPVDGMYDSSAATLFKTKEPYSSTARMHTTHTDAYAVPQGTPFPSAGMNSAMTRLNTGLPSYDRVTHAGIFWPHVVGSGGGGDPFHVVKAPNISQSTRNK